MRPDDLNVKILGIVGTPIKDGNCQYFLERALQAAESVGRVTTELIHLRDYRIEYCAGCESCLRRVHKIQKQVGLDVIPVPVKGYNCSIKDDTGRCSKQTASCWRRPYTLLRFRDR
ncbi:MAG: flavodoxin family protein [Deltaproteobacteria bacterium]|nr:flavodoxin family protein [Deltaproteobacteria bacterium]